MLLVSIGQSDSSKFSFFLLQPPCTEKNVTLLSLHGGRSSKEENESPSAFSGRPRPARGGRRRSGAASLPSRATKHEVDDREPRGWTLIPRGCIVTTSFIYQRLREARGELMVYPATEEGIPRALFLVDFRHLEVHLWHLEVFGEFWRSR